MTNQHALFRQGATRQDTQLAYKVRCYPWETLSTAARELICWRKGFFMHKQDLLAQLSADYNTFYREGREYKILWAYNCVPTEEEWNKKHERFHIYVDLRVSPAIADGPVALLDFKLPSSKLHKEYPESGFGL